jgi:hypothetical protein
MGGEPTYDGLLSLSFGLQLEGTRMVGPRKPPKDVDVLIGARICALRSARGMTVDEAASAAEMSVSDYVKGESGARRFHALELFNIARTLGVDMADIVTALQDD